MYKCNFLSKFYILTNLFNVKLFINVWKTKIDMPNDIC